MSRGAPSSAATAPVSHRAGWAARRLRPEERLILALDVPTVEQGAAIVDELGGAVGVYKIGLELLFAGGVDLARRLVADGRRIFIDAKLLDIDRTVAGAVANIARLGAEFVTVHAQPAAMRAAVEARGQSGLKILAVTLLTSLDAEAAAAAGLAGSVEEIVIARARQARDAGCDGVVASGREAALIRQAVGEALLIVTPGIRSRAAPAHDQKRVATPGEAIAAGADYLVVGREVLVAPDRRAAVAGIVAEIKRS